MQPYPYNYPLVLNDQDFLLYGGLTGTSTPAQRNVAYLLAEEQMTEHINAFLIPTVVTGTYFWKGGNPILLDYGFVNQVNLVTISSPNSRGNCSMDTVTGCHALRADGHYGYLDIAYLVTCSGCNHILGLPYNVQVVYDSGLQTGTSNSPSVMQALVLAAQINLNEIDVSLSNEGTADVGIQTFSSMNYSEVRAKLGNTAFGNSAVAQRIARLVRKYRSRPSIGFH